MDISFGTIVLISLCSIIGINISNTFAKFLVNKFNFEETDSYVFIASIVILVLLWFI